MPDRIELWLWYGKLWGGKPDVVLWSEPEPEPFYIGPAPMPESIRKEALRLYG